MNSRRHFIKSASIGAAGLAMSFSALGKSTDKLDRVGIITNTVGNEMKDDYKAAFKELADIGYKCIESGVHGDSAESFLKYLKSLGLNHIATGASMGGLQKDVNQYLRTAEALESKYIVCYWPWLSSAENLTYDEVMEAAERINTIGKKIKEGGFRFAWHNHDKEFRDINGQLAFDMILENTDPAYSTVQLDWYWVVKGGQDPVEYFKKYPGRFEIGHVKDMNNNKDGGITCVGNGIMDFDRIFSHADRGGVEYYIVENERAVKGMKCARESYYHIANILA